MGARWEIAELTRYPHDGKEARSASIGGEVYHDQGEAPFQVCGQALRRGITVRTEGEEVSRLPASASKHVTCGIFVSERASAVYRVGENAHRTTTGGSNGVAIRC